MVDVESQDENQFSRRCLGAKGCFQCVGKCHVPVDQCKRLCGLVASWTRAVPKRACAVPVELLTLVESTVSVSAHSILPLVHHHVQAVSIQTRPLGYVLSPIVILQKCLYTTLQANPRSESRGTHSFVLDPESSLDIYTPAVWSFVLSKTSSTITGRVLSAVCPVFCSSMR